MRVKVLFTGVVITLLMSSTTFGYAFAVGSANGAGYLFFGPPQVNADGGSFNYGGASGSVTQLASAYNPWGIGLVGQGAGAIGVQASYGPVQVQGYTAGMTQGAVKLGGTGSVSGMQYGGIQMNQASGGGMQSSYATGGQFSAITGGGSGVSSQSMTVQTTQVQVH